MADVQNSTATPSPKNGGGAAALEAARTAAEAGSDAGARQAKAGARAAEAVADKTAEASSAAAKANSEILRAWFDLTQKAVRTNLDAFGQMSGCRTVQELVTVQSNLLRDNLQQAIESGEVIARASSDAIREATRAMQAPAHPAI